MFLYALFMRSSIPQFILEFLQHSAGSLHSLRASAGVVAAALSSAGVVVFFAHATEKAFWHILAEIEYFVGRWVAIYYFKPSPILDSKGSTLLPPSLSGSGSLYGAPGRPQPKKTHGRWW